MPTHWSSVDKAHHAFRRPNIIWGRRQQLFHACKLIFEHLRHQAMRHPLLTFILQALTAMVRELRRGNGQNGLILANGGVLTYQHALCLSTRPRRDGSAYPDKNPLPTHLTDVPIPKVAVQVEEGEAKIEVSLSRALTNPSCSPSAQFYRPDLHRRIQPKRNPIERIHSGSTDQQQPPLRCEYRERKDIRAALERKQRTGWANRMGRKR